METLGKLQKSLPEPTGVLDCPLHSLYEIPGESGPFHSIIQDVSQPRSVREVSFRFGLPVRPPDQYPAANPSFVPRPFLLFDLITEGDTNK